MERERVSERERERVGGGDECSISYVEFRWKDNWKNNTSFLMTKYIKLLINDFLLQL